MRRHGQVFYAYVTFVEDPAFRSLSATQLTDRQPEGYWHSFLMVVDEETTRSPEHPILVVDLYTEPGRTFRAVPNQIQAIQNNLSISNMDFSDFADNVDADGVFRGFK